MLNRREFISYTWIASLVTLVAAGLGMGLRYAQPRTRAGRFGGRFNIGPLTQLPPAGSPPLNEPAGRFWLIHTSAGLLALHKACTHLDCLCEWDEQNRQFVCPCHGSRFAEDGARLTGPAPRGLDRFVLQVETATGRVVAQTDPETGAPLAIPEPSVRSGNPATADEELLLFVDTGRKIQMRG